MLTKEDKQALIDCALTIESGLTRISEIEKYDDRELCEAIRYSGDRIERGLCLIAAEINRHLA